MKKFAFIAAMLWLFALPSCKKSSTTQPAPATVKSVNDIKPPAGFNWQSERDVTFTASITDTRFGSANHAITIYDGDPYAGGNVIAKGSATISIPFTVTANVASQLTEAYIVKTSPDNSKIIQKVTLANTVNVSFADTDPTVTAGRNLHRPTTGPDCSSGCTNTITSNATNVNVNTGDVICITGSNITVGFASVNGGTVRVCGSNVALSNFNLNGSTTLIITATGSVNLTGINFNSSASSIINYGTITGTIADGGIFTNYGTFTTSGDFNLNSSSGAFNNYGTMRVNGNFNNGSNTIATNSGSLTVTGQFQQNGGAAAFVNNCSLVVGGAYNQSSTVRNASLIKVSGTATINSGTQLGLYNGAMLETNGFILDGSVIQGYGSTSLVKITGSVNIRNSGAVITGAVQVCSGTSVDGTRLTGGAATGCSLYIPVTGCNADGNGTASVPDTDGDGVPDNLDDYPADATKAYNNYYPSGTGATVAFEDQWPSKGDFDFNDVVVGYKYTVVTNASNVVVQVTGAYSLLATGGSYGNGFGVQFPIVSAKATGLTGGTLEAGQTNAVVIVFNNMRDEMANWNTQPGVAQSAVKNYTVSFNVTAGPNISTFGLNSYNPFIWNYGLGYYRGREIHLPGQKPTDLGDQTLFGTKDDSTVLAANRTYVTKSGLPYAINIPVTPFNYPVEATDITQAFLHFAAWGTSGGSSFADWYSNLGTGYRNTSLIYTN